jgi:hypothetical protein
MKFLQMFLIEDTGLLGCDAVTGFVFSNISKECNVFNFRV